MNEKQYEKYLALKDKSINLDTEKHMAMSDYLEAQYPEFSSMCVDAFSLLKEIGEAYEQ